MPAKTNDGLAKVIAVIFTSLIAPILVNVVVADLKGDVSPHATAQVPSQSLPTKPPVAEPDQASDSAGFPTGSAKEVVRIVVRSDGTTREEALQNALHAALCQALARMFDAASWQRVGPLPVEECWRDRAGLNRRCTELGRGTAMKDGRFLYQTEVAVEFCRQSLVERLNRAVQQR
jgi:hypothetical protein